MNHKPTKIGETLQSLLQEMGLEQKLKQFALIDFWPELVGENIALFTSVDKIRDNILYVKVKSMTWRTELLFQKPHILSKIEEKFGKGLVSDIRFH